MATLGFDEVVRLWDVASARELRRWQKDPGRPVNAARGTVAAVVQLAPTVAMNATEP